MTTQQRPYVDFQQVKRLVPLPEVLEAFGILDRFLRAGHTLAGVCPLPEHQHGPYPNPQQFKATIRDGVWFWHCFGDCGRGGDVVDLVKSLTGYDNGRVRFWFAEHFGDRLTLQRPKANRDTPPPQTKEAREVEHTPQRAKEEKSSQESNVPTDDPSIKPLRFRLKLETPVPYLRRRGLTEETVERYGLGLCRKGLLKGYVAIPVFRYPRDENPVAYLGRWPGDDFDESDGRPRYKWPAGFPKQQIVYGLAEALETPDDSPLIVVEGPFAVYHLVQSGFPTTVALFGSSLSDAQAEQLIGTGRPILLLFDGDESGRAGMRKAAGKLIPQTFVRAVKLPDGRQPDHLSPAELRSLISCS